jgi:hypothetical protein
MLTLEDLYEKILHKLDIEELIELLQVSSDDLLDRFEDRVEIYMGKLLEAVEDES